MNLKFEQDGEALVVLSHRPMKQVVAIVDAFSAAKQYAPEFRRRGFNCVHIQSDKEIPEVYAASFIPSDFVAHFVPGDSLLNELRKMSVTAVIAGTEIGVPLADELSEGLGLRTNGTAQSAARRDKTLMWQTVRDAGIPTARFFATADWNELKSWVLSEGLSRVVLKPPASAGSDSVYVCKTSEQMEIAFQAILGKTNRLGLSNGLVLAQELIEGREYVVNVVGLDGVYAVTDIMGYEKSTLPNGEIIYERDEILDEQSETVKSLVDYVKRVLGALGIVNGPAHTEVWMTADGPRLMETAARVDGLVDVKFARQLAERNQIDLTVDAYCYPEVFREQSQRSHRLLRQASIAYLISRQDGIIRSFGKLDDLRNLPSFNSMNIKVKPGERIVPTKDLFTCPGYVYLVHEEAERVAKDYAQIREMEKVGFFEVAVDQE